MVQAERMQEILALLKENGFITVDYLVSRLHYSPATVRRDLRELASLGLIDKNWGGASLAEDVPGHAVPYLFRRQKNTREKQEIARAAAALIGDGMNLFLDGSSTASFLLPYIAAHRNVSVVTNNLPLLSELHRAGVPAVCTGGLLNGDGNALFGVPAENTVEARRADVCFFSANSLDEQGDITDLNDDAVRLVRAMLRGAKTRVFLCDRSKFDSVSPVLLATLREIDVVVCPAAIRDALAPRFPAVSFWVP